MSYCTQRRLPSTRDQVTTEIQEQTERIVNSCLLGKPVRDDGELNAVMSGYQVQEAVYSR